MKKPAFIVLTLIIILSSALRFELINNLPIGTNDQEYLINGFDDEPAHLNYILYLKEHDQFPVLESKITDQDAFVKNEFEYHQPPLYYLIVAKTSILLGLTEVNILHLGRILNLLLFTLSIFIFYKIFKYYGFDLQLRLFAIAIYIGLGTTIYNSILVSNDWLSWVLIWSIFYYSIKDIPKNYLLISILLSLLHYTKFNVVLVYPFLIYILWHKRDQITKIQSISVLILPILFAFPWYLRNYEVYGSAFVLGGITGEKWHFVNSVSESISRLKLVMYKLYFRMYFNQEMSFFKFFNYVYYLWVFFGGIYLIKDIKNWFKNNSSGLVFLLTNIFAYLFFVIPTGLVEARHLFPILPIIIISMLLMFKNKQYQKILFLLISYLIILPLLIILSLILV